MEIEIAIKKLVDYVEDNFHKNIDSYEIESITGIKYNKFSLIFKQVCGIKLKKYTKSRCLTKMIIEIKNNKKTIYKSNLSPYPNHIVFSEAFKKEFGIPPGKFLDIQREELLCEKLNLEILFKKYKKNEVLQDELLKEYLGHKICALNYLLSLNAYSITNLDENFGHPLGLGYKLLNRRYLDGERELISTKSMSVDRYMEEINILAKYYDINTYLVFPQIHEWGILSNRKYFLVKRQLINRLMNNCDLTSILQVNKLKTIFLHFTNMNKLSAISEIEEVMKYKYYYENNEKHLLDKIDRLILKSVCLQDIGIKKYETIDNLIQSMKMELDFQKEVIKKKIIKLLKEGLLYLDECIYVDYENDLEEEFAKEKKELLKEVKIKEKTFLNLLKKIKKYIVSITVDGESTKVKYNYKAIKFIDDEKITNISYGFRYKDEKFECSGNIYLGLKTNNEYVELHFSLSDNWLSKFDRKVKDDFKKKIMDVVRLINKGSKDEEQNIN